MEAVLDHLRQSSATDADYKTFFRPMGTYQAKDETDLWLSISQQAADDSDSAPYGLGERVPTIAPVIVMGRLIFSGTPPASVQDLHLHEFVLNLTLIYQDLLEQYLVLPENADDRAISLSAGILLPGKTGFEITSTGFQVRFRIQFLNVKVKTSEQGLIRKKVIEKLTESGIRNTLTRDLLDGQNSWEAVLQDLSQTAYIPVYGSIEEETQVPIFHRELVGRLDPDGIEMRDYDVYEAEDMFMIRNHELVARGQIQFTTIVHDEVFSNNIDARYPLMYSTRYGATMVKTKPSLYEAPLNRSSSRASMTGNMDQVMELMNMISLDRSMEVGPWEMIGQALYTEFKNNGDIDEGLDEWIKFTLRCERSPFTEEDCERRYHTFQECFRTRKTLAYFARQDSPDQYRRWKDEWIREALMAATDRLSVQLVAQAFFRFAWETFLFDGKSWYHFKQHTWHTMGDSVFQELLADRQKGLYHAFLNLEIELSRKAAELRDNKAERDLLDQQKGIIFKIQGWLDAPKSQKSIMEAAQKMFLVKEFSRIADTNFNLMGCDDCVIDTSGNKAKMRPGMAEDWVTLSCGHSLLARPHLHYGSSLVQEVLYYFQQLFPNKEMNYLAWMICASLIQGGNPHKKIIALVGPTHAGKSGFVDALSRALGPYSGILHSSELDGSRARGGDDATPGKLQRKVTNLMTCGELKGTGKGGVWSWELINRLSGEDMEGGRQLYKGMEGNDSRSIQFRQRNKTFVHTNSVPRVDPNAHESTRERLDTWLVFESKFSYQAPRDTDEQFRQRIFPRDDSFKQKLNDWARALLWIMVQKFEEYKQVRYPVPEISKKKADDYWNECDVYSQFIRSRIEKVDQQQWEEEQKEMGMDEKPDPPLLEMGQLYPLFSSWYKERNPGQRIPNYHDFKEGVLDRIGRFDSDDGWLWWRLKEKRRSAGNGPMRV